MIHRMTRAQALAAAAQILEDVEGPNATDVVVSLAAAAQAYIQLANALGKETLTWNTEEALASGQLTSI